VFCVCVFVCGLMMMTMTFHLYDVWSPCYVSMLAALRANDNCFVMFVFLCFVQVMCLLYVLYRKIFAVHIFFHVTRTNSNLKTQDFFFIFLCGEWTHFIICIYNKSQNFFYNYVHMYILKWYFLPFCFLLLLIVFVWQIECLESLKLVWNKILDL
jgi:hypothetical protein